MSVKGIDWNRAKLLDGIENIIRQDKNFRAWGYAVGMYQSQLEHLITKINTPAQNSIMIQAMTSLCQALTSEQLLQSFSWSQGVRQLLESRKKLAGELQELLLCLQGRSEDIIALGEEVSQHWTEKEKEILRQKALALVKVGLQHLQATKHTELSKVDVLELVNNDGDTLADLDETWRRDKEVALAAVQSKGEALQYVHKELFQGVDGIKIICAAIRKNPRAVLLLDNKDVYNPSFLAKLIIVHGGVLECVQGRREFWQKVAMHVSQELEVRFTKYPRELLDKEIVVYYVRLIRILVCKCKENKAKDSMDSFVWKPLGRLTSSITKEMSQDDVFMKKIKEECAFIFAQCYTEKWMEEWTQLLSDAPIFLYEALQTSLADEIPIDFICEAIRQMPCLAYLLFENAEGILTQECLTRTFYLIVRQAAFAARRDSGEAVDACIRRVMECVTIFSFIPEGFVKDPKHSILEDLLAAWKKLFPYLQNAWREDEAKMLSLVQSMGQLFTKTPWLQKDQTLVRSCIQRCGFLLAGAEECLRKDKQFLLEQVEKNPSVMWGAAEALRRCPEVMKEVVQINPSAFLGASCHVRRDGRLLQDILVPINRNVALFAHMSLRSDRKWALELLTKYPKAIYGIAPSLLVDVPFLAEAARQNKEVLGMLSQSAQKQILWMYPELLAEDFSQMSLRK